MKNAMIIVKLHHVLSGDEYTRHLSKDGIKRLLATLETKRKHLENHHNVEDRHKFIARADNNISTLLEALVTIVLQESEDE